MIYSINAQIDFLDYHKLTLKEVLEFDDEEVTVSATSFNDGLELMLTLNADTLNQANSIAELKLAKISGLLAWRYDIPIPGTRITGYSYSKMESNEGQITVGESITGKCGISVEKNLEKEERDRLVSALSNSLAPATEDVLFMWRDAVSEQSKSLKFILLFRILEYILKGRKNLEAWIKTNYPTVALKHDKRKNEDQTIFAYLRDNIHPRFRDFPFSEIEANLAELQAITKRAIHDQFNI